MKNFYVVCYFYGKFEIVGKFKNNRLAKKLMNAKESVLNFSGAKSIFIFYAVFKSKTRELLLNRLSGY